MSAWRVTLTDYEISEADVEAVMDTLRSGWLTMGPRTQELERAFAGYAGAAHAVAVSSASAALHLACTAVGVGDGDEVVVPALSFAADAHAPRLAGGSTVLADVESPLRPVVGAEQIEARITERTKAVILVHMFGYTADAEEIARLCAERGIVLIEDCAQAAAAELPSGAKVGTAGACGCFSFFSKTPLGVGEGGILITDDDDLADRVRSLRSHAMTSVTWDRHRGHAETYDVTDLGFNYRLDEPRAALAHARLGRLGEVVAELRLIGAAYRERLADLDGVEVCFDAEASDRASHFSVPVLVADAERRDLVRARMREAGVQTTAYPCLSRLTAYAEAERCPTAEAVADRHIALPAYAGLGEERIDTVVEALRTALG